MLKDKRIRIIIGHYGSGKTEFSVNYAIKLSQMGQKVALADLDVVNPYFRSREKAEMLERLGIKVISSSIKAPAIDVPAISAEVLMPFQDKRYQGILDVGGDPAGARVLGRYREEFKEDEYDMFCVINANRPETDTAEKAIKYLRNIEATARAKVSGLINNTHLLEYTTKEEVMKGQKIVEAVSKATNIPVKYVAVIEKVAKEIDENTIQGMVFPIKMIMREEWMLNTK